VRAGGPDVRARRHTGGLQANASGYPPQRAHLRIVARRPERPKPRTAAIRDLHIDARSEA